MDSSRDIGHTGSRVLVFGLRSDTQRKPDDRILLSVSQFVWRRLRQGHGPVQVARVLRGTVMHHRLLLLLDGPPPDDVHPQHAGRTAAHRPIGSDPGPEKGGQDGTVVRHHIHGELLAVSYIHGVVPLLQVFPGRIRRLLARVPHRRFLFKFHQLVCEPGGPVLYQRRVP